MAIPDSDACAKQSTRTSGKAWASLIGLGAIGTLIVGLLVVFFSVIPYVEKIQDAKERLPSANNLKIIGDAMHDNQDHTGGLPPAAIMAKNGNPGLSWRVALLPYIEEKPLYAQFKLDEPWDSPSNKELLSRIPLVYRHPKGDPAKTAAGFTYYRVFVGPGTPFDPTVGHKLRLPQDFPDGGQNTLLVVEAADPIEWTRPETDDFQYSASKSLPKFGGRWTSGFHVLLGDGTVIFVPKEISEEGWRNLITSSNPNW
jgi:hypothetical protein